MSPSLAPAVIAARPRATQCNRDVKLHLPEVLYDDLAPLARMDQRPAGDSMRKVLERHVEGCDNHWNENLR